MGLPVLLRNLLRPALGTSLMLMLGTSMAHAQWLPFCRPRPECPAPAAPIPPPSVPEQKEAPKRPLVEPKAFEEQLPTTATAAATGGGGFLAPNMMGDLLGAGRSQGFFYQRTQGNSRVGIPAVFIN